jgi:hypothetical protein
MAAIISEGSWTGFRPLYRGAEPSASAESSDVAGLASTGSDIVGRQRARTKKEHRA